MSDAAHRIFLVEDHAVMRTAVAAMLAAEPDLELSGTAGSAEVALNVGAWTACDLVLTDVGLPGMDGFALAERLRAHRPGFPVVVMSATLDPAVADRARSVGVSAFVKKADLADTLPDTLRRVLAPPASDRR